MTKASFKTRKSCYFCLHYDSGERIFSVVCPASLHPPPPLYPHNTRTHTLSPTLPRASDPDEIYKIHELKQQSLHTRDQEDQLDRLIQMCKTELSLLVENQENWQYPHNCSLSLNPMARKAVAILVNSGQDVHIVNGAKYLEYVARINNRCLFVLAHQLWLLGCFNLEVLANCTISG